MLERSRPDRRSARLRERDAVREEDSVRRALSEAGGEGASVPTHLQTGTEMDPATRATRCLADDLLSPSPSPPPPHQEGDQAISAASQEVPREDAVKHHDMNLRPPIWARCSPSAVR